MRPAPNRHRRATDAARRGFTLVELMVVVGVVGIGMALVTSSIDSLLPKERLNTGVREMTAVLRDTRSQAIGRGLEFFIEYDLAEERYRRVTPFVLGGGRFDPESDEESERVFGEWSNLPDGVEIESVGMSGEVYTDERVFARFDPRGAASDHQVVLSQPQYENYYTIEVLALTGTFKFHRGIFLREAPNDGDFE
ncbi:MAG: prepilin-type N-terminal cleavage/methylation domain-containing protein [Planctomycetota bacterium]